MNAFNRRGISLPSHEEGNRFSFRNVVFFSSIYNSGPWAKFRNPGILKSIVSIQKDCRLGTRGAKPPCPQLYGIQLRYRNISGNNQDSISYIFIFLSLFYLVIDN
jgi:hypothetical protein